MTSVNRYDVTAWPIGDPYSDIGVVINSIVADVKRRQAQADANDGGKPGAVIYIPPGDYRLRTQALIDVSYLRLEGSGHGFTSSSIRFNVPVDEWDELHELWPGGSRILVDLARDSSSPEASGAAFLVRRPGSPRISSVEFSNFCIDGLHYTDDGSGLGPENSYVNGKTGIYVADANDSFMFSEMGFVYLENALTVYNADALSVRSNFIAECGSCVELRGWGQACKVTDNHIGAGPHGRSISAENHGGLLIAGNNVFPRGSSSVHLSGVTRSSVTGNRLHSFYPGMVVLADGSSENLISSNHLLRDEEPWTPFEGVGNGLDDSHGLVIVDGSANSVIGNHISLAIDASTSTASYGDPVVMRVVAGESNFIATNHVIARGVSSATNDSCFEAQVDSLLHASSGIRLSVATVVVEELATATTVLDCGTEDEVIADRAVNAVRALPKPGARLNEPSDGRSVA